MGVLLQGDTAALATAIGPDDVLPVDSRMEVHFRGPKSEGERRHILLRGIAVRRFEGSLGVQFPDGIPSKHLDLLIDRARQFGVVELQADKVGKGASAAPVEMVGEEQLNRIARECAVAAASWMRRFITTFLSELRRDLGECTRRAISMRERDVFSEALQRVMEQTESMQQSFPSFIRNLLVRREVTVNTAIAANSGAAAAAVSGDSDFNLFGSTGLSIVEKDRFEEWLVTAETNTALERDVTEELFMLQNWFGLLHPEWQRKDHLPIGPAVIARGVNQALESAGIEDAAHRQAVVTFGRIAKESLQPFYRRFIARFEKSGAFPTVRQVVERQLKKRRSVPSNTASAPIPSQRSLTDDNPSAPMAEGFTSVDGGVPAPESAASQAVAPAVVAPEIDSGLSNRPFKATEPLPSSMTRPAAAVLNSSSNSISNSTRPLVRRRPRSPHQTPLNPP